MKIAGREAGGLCIVIEKKDESYVLVTGPRQLSGVKRRTCNIRHLEPLETILTIAADADDEAIEKAIEEAGLTDKFRKKIRLDI